MRSLAVSPWLLAMIHDAQGLHVLFTFDTPLAVPAFEAYSDADVIATALRAYGLTRLVAVPYWSSNAARVAPGAQLVVSGAPLDVEQVPDAIALVAKALPR